MEGESELYPFVLYYLSISTSLFWGLHLPKDIRYMTHFNRDRDAINMTLFEECCARLTCHNVSTRDTVIILADKLAAKTSHGNYDPFHNWKIFRENRGEDDIKFQEWIHC